MIEYNRRESVTALEFENGKELGLMNRQEAALDILKTIESLFSKKPSMELQNCSRGEAMVLHLVSMHPEGITPGQLREKMEVSSARIAAVLGTLEEKGMLLRQADSHDRRRIQVVLTSQGIQRTRQDRASVLSHVEHSLEVLEDAEITCFLRVLHKIEKLHAEEASLC